MPRGKRNTKRGLTMSSVCCPRKNAELLKQHAAAEKHRGEMLTTALAKYRRECDERERQVAQTNAGLDTFKKAFQSGDADALVQYVG